MPVINGVYLKDFPALPSSVADANIIPIAITGDQVAYRTTVAGIVTDARVTSKLLTGLSVTGSTILATDTILQAFGKVQNQLNGKVSSVGLTMPAAFNVANSPITSAGTLAVTAAGVASQYIRGDGALADFPTTAGGGSSVSYYLNGSVSQGTFVGNTYYEMNKTPVIGTGTDFTINANGYIAQFITDANDPASLLIPAGNWNVEMYFSASSNGGSPSFYVEVYKYDGSTFTLLGSSSATPEGITNGTAIDIYYTSVGIPETVLTITDRIAIRVYVTHSGRTIKLHTEDNHLSEIITTFSNGLTTLNGLTKQAQYFAVGSTGTDFAIVSSVDTHTFNIPSASATARGLITTGSQTIAGDKTLTGTLFIARTSPSVQLKASDFSVGGFVLGNSAGTAHWSLETDVGAAGAQGEFRLKNQILNTNAINISTSNLVTLTGGLVGTTANFTGQLTLGSTITNGTYTYTLPSATGTLALTSALSGYVDLTTNQSIAGEKTFTDKLTVSFGASPSAAIQATTTNAGGKALSCLADSTSEPFTVKQLGSGKLATFFRQIAGTPDERVTILNDGSIYTGGKVAIGTISAGNGGVDSVVVRNSTDTELKIVGTTGTGSAVFSASPTFTGVPIFGSSISNGTYTYTLPSATGTLALTSNITSAISGTTNYIPKFTSANVIGNSSLINDATGNLGLGVTPSAWNTIKPIEIGNAGNFFAGFQGASAIYMGTAAYYNSGWKYATTGDGANLIEAGNGIFTFSNAASGTAGNSLTWTPRLTIASTGAANFSNSLRIQGSTVPTSGSGTELAWDGTNGYLLAFNRTTSAYLPLSILGSTLSFTGAATFSSGISVGGATATTGGIQFPATAVAIADANNLDDYEEGTWTPVVTCGSGTATYASQLGFYTKIGRVVTITYILSFTKNTLSGSTVRLTNLPFSLIGGTFYPQGTVLFDNLSTTTNNITLQGANNSAAGDFIGGNGGTTDHVGLPTTTLGSGTMALRGTLTYFAA